MDLVIGGSGFIGCRLVEVLKSNRHRVRVLDINPFPSDEVLQPDDIVTGSMLDEDTLKTAMQGCQTIYHLAGIPLLWHRDPAVFNLVNVRGTENVVKAIREMKSVDRLVYTSTESILVPRRYTGPVTEAAETSIKDMIGPYCRSKFLAECCVSDLAASGFPAVIVNPTMPIGPCDRNLTPPGKMIRDFLLGKIKGYMAGVLNFVDVRDVAMGHYLAMKHGIANRRYILAGYNLSVNAFFDRLAAISGQSSPRFRVPYLLALSFSYLEEWYGKATGRQPLSSVTGVRLLRRSLIFDGSRTWQQLGDHVVYPFEKTLEDAVAWHCQQLSAN